MKLNYIFNRKKRLVGNSKLTMFLILVWSFFNATQAYSQSLIERKYIADRSSVRLKELDTGFQALHGAISSGMMQSLNETDLGLIDDALRYRPYYQDSIRIMANACDYYSSTMQVGESEIDIDYLVDLLTESSRVEYEGKESFLKATYESLSTRAKGRINELIRLNQQSISNRESISFDYEWFAQENSRDLVLERVSRVCERLPIVMEMFPASGYIEIIGTAIDARD